MPRFPRWLVLAPPLVIGAVVLVGPVARSEQAPVVRATAAPPLAATVLAGIPVKGRAPKTGYSREAFGPAWADVDRNGCDTRNDILKRDLTQRTVQPSTRDCVVLSGVLADPYTGRTIRFAKANASAVQIDHVVALSDAWQKGAQGLTAARRQQLANDPLNLLAVDGPANQQKGDGDAATWLPANASFRCTYVARQVAVKAAYGLWVTTAERDATKALLGRCPTQVVPSLAALPAAATTTTTTTARPAATTTTARPPSTTTTSMPPSTTTTTTARPATTSTTAAVYYANCDAARRAGAAPLHRGDPGYRPALDRDGDGIACE